MLTGEAADTGQVAPRKVEAAHNLSVEGQGPVPEGHRKTAAD